MIKQTTDYEIFKKHDHNREVVETHVQKLMRSISSRNLLEFRPILVDAEYRVIDGQNRLEAAKRLKVPIFYEVQPNLTVRDIITLNDSAKIWSREDYLNFYCTEGNREYIKLKNFMNKHKLSLAMALVILGLKSESGFKSKNTFKTGKFVFPLAHEEINSVTILQNSDEIINYIQPKIQGKTGYLKGPAFRRALYIFLSIKAVDFPTFMDKIAHRVDLIRPCARIGDFVNTFKTIYNWRNQNKITIDEFEVM